MFFKAKPLIKRNIYIYIYIASENFLFEITIKVFGVLNNQIEFVIDSFN